MYVGMLCPVFVRGSSADIYVYCCVPISRVSAMGMANFFINDIFHIAIVMDNVVNPLL